MFKIAEINVRALRHVARDRLSADGHMVIREELSARSAMRGAFVKSQNLLVDIISSVAAVILRFFFFDVSFARHHRQV